MKNKVFSFLPVIIVIGISLLTILPLFQNGFFPMHDDTQVQRVYEMHRALADGMFPVRWVADLGYGYGYPLFNFYGPLAYYIGGFFAFLMDSLLATKAMIAVAMIGSGITMYYLAKSFWGKAGGIVSAAFYILAPYHAVDLYVRGDIGELWAYIFFPLALLGVWKIYKKPSWVSMGIGAVGFAGVILSHNLSAFLFTPFLLVALLVSVLVAKKSSQKKVIAYDIGLLTIGIALSLFYSLPVLSEMKYTNVLSQVGGGADFHNHFVCLTQLWQSQWGFGGSAAGCIDGVSFMMGKLHILLSLVALVIVPFIWKRKDAVLIATLSIVGLLVSVFLMLPQSVAIWEKIPQMAFLQYPWRYLMMAALLSSLLAGMVVWFVVQKLKIIGIVVSVILLAGVLVLNYKYFKPQFIIPTTSEALTSPYALNWTTSKISDEYMPKSFLKPSIAQDIPHTVITSSADVIVQKQLRKTQEIDATFHLAKAQSVLLSLAYFPGWVAQDNGREVVLQPVKKGIQIYLPAGNHSLRIWYVGTFAENLSNILSLTSVIILILGIIWEIRQTYERKSS